MDVFVIGLLVTLILLSLHAGIASVARRFGRGSGRGLWGVVGVVALAIGITHLVACTRVWRAEHAKKKTTREARRTVYCYHRTMHNFDKPSPKQRRRAVEGVRERGPSPGSPGIWPARRSATPPPHAKPAREPMGPSCRLHPRVLTKVRAALERDEEKEKRWEA